jgi:hypothetical protein
VLKSYPPAAHVRFDPLELLDVESCPTCGGRPRINLVRYHGVLAYARGGGGRQMGSMISAARACDGPWELPEATTVSGVLPDT